jgi:hypothetical protein
LRFGSTKVQLAGGLASLQRTFFIKKAQASNNQPEKIESGN